MRRREFLEATGLGVLGSRAMLGAGLPVVAAAEAVGANQAPAEPALRTGPYLQDPTADGMTVMWMTTVPSYGYVEFGPTEQLGQKADADVDGLRQANNLLHRVRIDGLKPGQECFYRVCFQPITTFEPYKIVYGPTVRSSVAKFTTRDPASDRVRFVVYNDLHDNLELWRGLHALVKDQKFDFAFLNGDITDFLTDEQQMVGHFLDLCTEFFAGSTPFLYARGNHEVRGAYSREMKKFLALPDDRYYYAFSQGPARFVVLDSGEDKDDATPVYAGLCNFDEYRTLQQQWLENEIKSEAWRSAKFRIAIFHIPPFYSGDWHGPMDVQRKWAPLLNQGKTDLYLGGHTHKYTVAKADASQGHTYPVVIGGGPKAGKATVMTVEADAQHIHVKMIRDDGQVVGEIEV